MSSCMLLPSSGQIAIVCRWCARAPRFRSEAGPYSGDAQCYIRRPWSLHIWVVHGVSWGTRSIRMDPRNEECTGAPSLTLCMSLSFLRRALVVMCQLPDRTSRQQLAQDETLLQALCIDPTWWPICRLRRVNPSPEALLAGEGPSPEVRPRAA